MIRERLDALKAEVRAPLTAYEQAEADRQAALRAPGRRVRARCRPDDPFTDSETVAERIAEVASH